LIGFPAPPFDNDDVTVDTPPAGADAYEELIGVGLGDADSRSLRSESDVGMIVDFTRSFSIVDDVGGDEDVDTAVVPVRFRKKLRTRCVGFEPLLN